jgi:hypothetical protein
MASEKLGVASADLTVTDGVVHAISDPAKHISYADLIGGRPLDAPVEFHGEAQQLTVKVEASLKKPEAFKVIGKSYPRRDLPGKVFGTLTQVADLKLPNMAHGRMIRPPVAGAVPVTVDEKSIAGIADVQVVRIKDFLAVVAEKEWNAVKAARQLKVKWSESKPNFPGHDKLFDHIRNAPVVARSGDRNVRAVGASQERGNGDMEEAFKRAVANLVNVHFNFGTLRCHDCSLQQSRMGPLTRICEQATDFDGDNLHIWPDAASIPWTVPYNVTLDHNLIYDAVQSTFKCGARGDHSDLVQTLGYKNLTVTNNVFDGNGKVLFHATDELWRWRYRA